MMVAMVLCLSDRRRDWFFTETIHELVKLFLAEIPAWRFVVTGKDSEVTSMDVVMHDRMDLGERLGIVRSFHQQAVFDWHAHRLTRPFQWHVGLKETATHDVLHTTHHLP
jgi:hypothetical protein